MENGSNATIGRNGFVMFMLITLVAGGGGAFFYSNSQVVRGADKKASVLLGEKGMKASARAKAEANQRLVPSKSLLTNKSLHQSLNKRSKSQNRRKRKNKNHHLILMLHSPHLVPQIQVQTINQNHRLLQVKKLKKWMLK